MMANVGFSFHNNFVTDERDCDAILHTVAYFMGPCGLKV